MEAPQQDGGHFVNRMNYGNQEMRAPRNQAAFHQQNRFGDD